MSRYVGFRSLVGPGAWKKYQFMTALVNNEATNLTLESLFIETPEAWKDNTATYQMTSVQCPQNVA